ncbi:MAG: thrombospondin type-1 domain-containing protein [Pseudomonadota bacterium]
MSKKLYLKIVIFAFASLLASSLLITSGYTQTNPFSSSLNFESSIVPYQWNTGPWSNCNRLCGNGQQNRLVRCVDNQGTNVDVSNCSFGPEPTSQRPCQMPTCVWQTGNWSCNRSCGNGVEERNILCTTQDGIPVPDAHCDHAPAPSTVGSACRLADCPWNTGRWRNCNRICGGGTQSRSVTCSGPTNADCSANRPRSSRSCNTQPCSIGGGCGGGTNDCGDDKVGGTNQDRL